MRRVSRKRARQNAERAKLMKEKFGDRIWWRCQFGRYYFMDLETSCHGELNGHELLKRSRGGSITDMENVVILCNYHNGWVEDHPEAAHLIGLARHSWETP